MLKKLFVIVLLMLSVLAFGQDKPRLGVLPFTGGPSGDAETITTLLSYQSDFMGAFTMVPVTNAVRSQVLERDFQLSDWIDADAGARLGRMMNTEFVIAGQIRRIGARNLVVVSLINVNTFELRAGICREYGGLDEIPGMLPEMTKLLIDASRKDTSALPRLAVAFPFIAPEVTDRQEAEALLQILAIELANTGRYAVVPRLVAGQAVLRDLDAEVRNFTPVDGAKALGQAVNARFVLNTEIRAMGSANMVSAAIIGVENGNIVAGGYKNYFVMLDGCYLMADLARMLVPVIPALPPMPVPVEKPAPPPPPPPPPPPVEEPPPPPPPPAPVPAPVVEETPPVKVEPPAPPPVQVQRPAPPPLPEEEVPVKRERDPAKLWTLGVSAGTSFAVPWVIATFHGTIAPLKYTFIELGCDAGLLSGAASVDYYSLYPYANLALFVPFGKKGGAYVGAGGGYMMSFYSFPEGDIEKDTFALNVTAGFNVLNFLDISYTFKTNFARMSNKLSVGYTWRF